MKAVNAVFSIISMVYYSFLWPYIVQFDMRLWWWSVLLFWVSIILCSHPLLIIASFILPERK